MTRAPRPHRQPLVDLIEALGRAVDEGRISRDEAIADLTKSWRLTPRGAADLIDRWKSVRAEYAAIFAIDALRQVYGKKDSE